MSNDTPQRAAAWLAEGIECLAARIGQQPGRAGVDFDVVVVGSGYGGAVAASTLAGCCLPDGRALGVCVLERGREYLPGAFPGRMADLAGHVRFSTGTQAGARGEREGLFDVKVGDDVSALVANGLGGGSLINAGVMVEPGPAARSALEALTGPLDDHYQRARAMLGAEHGRVANTILAHESGPPLKYIALQRLADRLGQAGNCAAAPITVAMRRHRNAAGVMLDACKLCGDCATGCNFNAKESLDTNLLVRARRQGAQLFTGATVVRLTRDGDGAGARWCLHVELTDAAMRRRLPDGFTLYAGKVILAAGTYGSTEILLNSRSADLPWSPMLGQKFSSNGDMIAVAYDQRQPANAVADENAAAGARRIGPTITGMIRVPGAAGDLLVEELAVPGPLRRVFEEIVATSATLHALGQPDRSVHAAHDKGHDPCAVDGRAIRHSSVLAVMGDDGAAGRMQLAGAPGQADGGLRVVWPELRHHRLFTQQAALLAMGGAGNPDHAADNGTILPNPLWKLLPDDMAYLLKGRRGPLLTVHPLGGCALGASARDGVVNGYGQVFCGADGSAVHDSLVVLDGAIVPLALGVNPALTITALALRAAEQLRRDWRLDPAGAGAAVELGPRPVFHATPDARAMPAPTVAQFIERLSGPVTLKDRAGMARECMVELTLRFDPRPLGALFLPDGDAPVPLRRTLQAGAGSTLAIYDCAGWTAWRMAHEGSDTPRPDALVHADLAGTLDFFQREDSHRLRRVMRALLPWARHRGLRDTWQWRFGAGDAPAGAGDAAGQDTAASRLRSALALASRAGEVRRFDYQLTIHNARGGPGRIAQLDADAGAGFDPAAFEGAAIAGAKRLTYAYGASPWSQLMRMTLSAFPRMPARAEPPVLALDTGFLINENVPLLRVMTQEDQPTALGDLAGLAGYMLRLLLYIHMWSFRKPDQAPPRVPARLPPELPGLRMERTWLPFPDLQRDGKPPLPVHALLTRYRGAHVHPALPPVLMIHGYSASGTTFAHGVVNPNLASYLCARGRDVWVLDMRTSSGMATATHPWEFEDAAHNDIPVAVAQVCQATGHAKIDVVAHCMGAAMFSMAVLGRPGADAPYRDERLALPGRVNRLVLSQVGPLVVFSQANIFRAYLMGYVRFLLPNVTFPFRVEGAPGMMDELVDRLLATVPYSQAEFKIENPAWPWQRADFAATRHRMDALYGRDFQLANLTPAVLDHIDDFFGPYNLVTLNQAIHFARLKTVTNRAGRNPYVSRRALKEKWTFPTHSIHGEENGLSDVSTLERMRAILTDAGCTYSSTAFKDFGHQDSLIGRGAATVFQDIDDFLNDRLPAPETPAAAPGLIARAPWSGPVRSGMAHARDGAGIERTPVGAAASPAMHEAAFVALVPVVRDGARYAIFDPGHATGIGNVELFRAPDVADVDGWVQLSARTAPAGADGVMMLMMYDASGGFEPVPDPGQPLLLRAALMAPLPGFGPAGWGQSKELDAAVHAAIEKTLKDVPARELASAVIAAPATTPDDAGRAPDVHLCFAVGSCQYPGGLLDSVPAYASYARLAQRLDDPAFQPKPAFLALLGDQIYADATTGLFDPSALDDRYVRPYEKLFCNAAVKNVRRRLPTVSMLDDHEIADNWEPRQDGQPSADLAAGLAAYLKFQRTADLVPDGEDGPVLPGARLGFAFAAEGVHFYMADTRTDRQARTPFNAATAEIMRPAWFTHLTDWLAQRHAADPAAPKFIMTPSILAPGRIDTATFAGDARCLRYDGWAGYPASLRRLLTFIADNAIGNVVLLSGDEHISCDAVLRIASPGMAQVEIRAIHSSALYAPYPFANSCKADMADTAYAFSFASPADAERVYACNVRTEYVPGDGYALVSVQRAAGGWDVQCAFDRAGGLVATSVAAAAPVARDSVPDAAVTERAPG